MATRMEEMWPHPRGDHRTSPEAVSETRKIRTDPRLSERRRLERTSNYLLVTTKEISMTLIRSLFLLSLTAAPLAIADSAAPAPISIDSAVSSTT